MSIEAKSHNVITLTQCLNSIYTSEPLRGNKIILYSSLYVHLTCGKRTQIWKPQDDWSSFYYKQMQNKLRLGHTLTCKVWVAVSLSSPVWWHFCIIEEGNRSCSPECVSSFGDLWRTQGRVVLCRSLSLSLCSVSYTQLQSHLTSTLLSLRLSAQIRMNWINHRKVNVVVIMKVNAKTRALMK